MSSQAPHEAAAEHAASQVAAGQAAVQVAGGTAVGVARERETDAQRLAACIMGSLRTEDAFCRIGGEEFSVIARDSPLSDAIQLAERIRRLVAETKFVYDGVNLPITVSLGVASYAPDSHANAGQLLEEADRNLYTAKHAGRNCVRPVLAPA